MQAAFVWGTSNTMLTHTHLWINYSIISSLKPSLVLRTYESEQKLCLKLHTKYVLCKPWEMRAGVWWIRQIETAHLIWDDAKYYEPFYYIGFLWIFAMRWFFVSKLARVFCFSWALAVAVPSHLSLFQHCLRIISETSEFSVYYACEIIAQVIKKTKRIKARCS